MLPVARNASIALALMIPSAALASSDQAWDQFARQVEQKCTEAASEIFRRPQIAVDPTGTQNYGVAIVYGRSKAGKERAAVICVLDKKTGIVELGSELGNDIVRVRKPKPEGEDDNARPRNNRRKQQNQDDTQNDSTNGNVGGQDDMLDDAQ